jgi:hypothetical protein
VGLPLDLLIPDLLRAPGAITSPTLPSLEKWLARADLARVPGGAVAWLGRAFGLAHPIPVAAIETGGEGSWLRADPVHLRVGREGVQLMPAAALGIAGDEAAALVEALNAHFREDGLVFVASAAGRWHVRVPAAELPRTLAPEEARGRDVALVFPEGSGGISWRRALTEAQMILAAHEVNERRESAGKPAINSVWLWGGGSLPRQAPSPYRWIASTDAFVTGLGRLTATPMATPPATAAGIPDSAPDGPMMVQLAGLQAAIDAADAEAWREEAVRLERDWFARLGSVIARFGRVRLILPADADTLVATLDGSARWRLLRGAKPLASYA